jgi:hypothetical protein
MPCAHVPGELGLKSDYFTRKIVTACNEHAPEVGDESVQTVAKLRLVIISTDFHSITAS